MPNLKLKRAFRMPPIRPQTLTLVLLAVGLIVSLAANVREDRKTDRLAEDLVSLQLQNQRQVGELREAQSAAWEHDLLRIEELATQLQKTSDDELEQAASLATRTRSQLTRIVEQRHQEMITAISDLRADLRADAEGKANHQTPVKTPATIDTGAALRISRLTVGDAPAVPAGMLAQEPTESLAPPAQKKGFWGHLNPFSRNRSKKQESAENSAQ